MNDAPPPPAAVRTFCQDCGLADPERFFSRMAILAQHLFAANAQFNLTRIHPGNDFWVRHVADSLAAGLLLPELRTASLRLIDLGCGAGFPALVLAAAYPTLRVNALDSTRRKAEFVQEAAAALELANCTATAARGREYAAAHREEADIATARAVGTAVDLCREVHGLLRPGGRLVLYKTPADAEREACEVRTRTPAKTYDWTRTPECLLPEEAIPRVLLIGRKPQSA
jgi:16S rRNA (guanine527-N7)-methyltransferase